MLSHGYRELTVFLNASSSVGTISAVPSLNSFLGTLISRLPWYILMKLGLFCVRAELFTSAVLG